MADLIFKGAGHLRIWRQNDRVDMDWCSQGKLISIEGDFHFWSVMIGHHGVYNDLKTSEELKFAPRIMQVTSDFAHIWNPTEKELTLHLWDYHLAFWYQ